MDNVFSELNRSIYEYTENVLSMAFKHSTGEQPPTPQISIEAGMGVWGCYVYTGQGNLHLIKLEKDLVVNHPWYVVEDVLRHELAHYLKQWFYPYVEESSHGRMFRKMCEMLGANPHASENYPLLDEVLQQDGTEEGDASPIALKIRKLLALSESPNEHEAHLALMKARELMGKYSVTEVSASEDDKDPYVCVNKDLGDKVGQQEYGLASILVDFYDVRCIFCKSWNLPGSVACPNDSFVSICGRLSKVRVALYVWDYIWGFMENAWQADSRWAKKRSTKRVKRDFQVGCLDGIREVLTRQNKGETVAALVRMDADLDKYYHSRYPQITHTRSSYRYNPEAEESGREMGRTLKIHHGIEDAMSGVKQLKE